MCCGELENWLFGDQRRGSNPQGVSGLMPNLPPPGACSDQRSVAAEPMAGRSITVDQKKSTGTGQPVIFRIDRAFCFLRGGESDVAPVFLVVSESVVGYCHGDVCLLLTCGVFRCVFHNVSSSPPAVPSQNSLLRPAEMS